MSRSGTRAGAPRCVGNRWSGAFAPRCFVLALLLVPALAFAQALEDDRGRAVEALPDTPRIITLAPHLAELVFAAGAGESLVATVEYSDYPEAARDIPRIGDAFRIDFERLLTARPDLVLAWGGGNPPRVIEQLEGHGIQVAVLVSETLDDVARHLRFIGALAGTREPAVNEAAAYDERLVALRETYAGAGPVRVFYQVANRPLFTVGGGHVISDAIRLCGGRNVFASLPELAPSVGTESVLAAEPEVMLAGVHEPAPDPGELSQWTRWEHIPAVRDGHLYQLDASLLSRPTPRMLDGVAALCDRIERAR